MAASALSFDRYGPDEPASPVILSVPHAGRDYPLALRAALRVPVTALIPLEDRHVDAVAMLARGNETMLVQRVARAWIDLNRSEQERDPGIDDGANRQAMPIQSARMRGGLGLVPRRVSGAGDIWRRRLDGDEVMARIEMDHRPYHAALAEALKRARARFGTAVLLDLHSMPPLTAAQGKARIVLGDRFGRSASARFVHRLESESRGDGDRDCAGTRPMRAAISSMRRRGRHRASMPSRSNSIARSISIRRLTGPATAWPTRQLCCGG